MKEQGNPKKVGETKRMQIISTYQEGIREWNKYKT